MYSMKLFGFRLTVAEDDLALPALTNGVSRILWNVAAVVFLVIALGAECETAFLTNSLRAFAVTLLVIGLVTTAGWFAIFRIANTGGLHEGGKRRWMRTALKLQGAVYALEFLAGTFFTLRWSTTEDSACGPSSELGWVALTSIISLWGDLVSLAALWYTVLKPERRRGKDSTALDDFEHYAQQWHKRLRRTCFRLHCLSCRCSSDPRRGQQGDDLLSGIGEVFATFFLGLKMSQTELLVALLLVRAEQKEQAAAAVERSLVVRVDGAEDPAGAKQVKDKLQAFPSARTVHGRDADELLDHLARARVFALAANTWRLQLLMAWEERRPLGAVAKLVRGALKNARVRRAGAAMHRGDNCCAWHHTAFVNLAFIAAEDLVFSHFSSFAGDLVAFAIAVDHDNRTVGLCFRGSQTLADFVTDAAMQPESLAEAGRTWGFDGRQHAAHAGMLSAALKTRAILQETGVLHRLFRMPHEPYTSPSATGLSDLERSSIQQMDGSKLPDCTGYRLLVTGASLGAGVAAIEALLLRPAFPQIQGVGVSTPGCVVSRDLAESVSSYFTTVFVGKDVVPRLSWTSLVKLRAQLLDCWQRCKANKNTVMRSAAKRTRASDLLFAPGEVPDTPDFRRAAEAVRRVRESARGGELEGRLEQTPMFCPGRLVHLPKTRTEVTRNRLCSSSPYRMYDLTEVTNREDLASVQVCKSMFRDHMPKTILAAMQYVEDVRSVASEEL